MLPCRPVLITALVAIVLATGSIFLAKWIDGRSMKQTDDPDEEQTVATAMRETESDSGGTREPLRPDFEPSYLRTVITFASNLRVYAALALQEQRSKTEDPIEQRLLFLAIHQQMCMAMEDLGAHLYAFRQNQDGKDYLKALVGYGPSSAYLYELFSERTRDQLYSDFGFAEIPPFLRNRKYTDEDNENAARNFFEHFETVAEQQKRRMDICNKLKHGATVYLPESSEQLGVVLRKNSEPEPWHLNYKEPEVETFLYVTATCSHQTKEVVFRYLAINHPATAAQIIDDEQAQKDQQRSLELLEKLKHVARKPSAKKKRSKKK